MDLARPMRSLTNSIDAEVLSVLASTTDGRTGREIARIAGVSPAGAQNVLKRLSDAGIVHRRQWVGRFSTT